MSAPSSITCKAWVATAQVPTWSQTALTFAEVTIPAPSDTQVRVRIGAAGLNPVDFKRASFSHSESAAGRESATGTALKKLYHKTPAFPFPYVAGVDGAGEVECVGANVTGFNVGDRVIFHSDLSRPFGGTFCEYALVEADVLVPIPVSVSNSRPFITFEEAAAMPCSTWTVYVALFDKLRIERGRSIFIDGASGGVGSAAVQLAHYYGLRVLASCSTESFEYVRGLGADVTVDYRDQQAMISCVLASTSNVGVDYYLAVSKAMGAEQVSDVVRFGGAVCLISGVLVPQAFSLFSRQLSIHHVFLGGLHHHALTRPQLRHIGQQCMQLYADGAFQLKLEVLPFEKCVEGLSRIARGSGICGKLVLCVSEGL